jgi:aminopeptidase N
VRYELNLRIEKLAPLMKGEIEISVRLTETGAKNPLVLDWRTTPFANDKDQPYAKIVSVNEKSDVATIFEKEHILVPTESLKAGENIIRIEFASPIKTSGSAITRYVDREDGREYVYSLFVPSDASTAFPAFDQPDLKARFSLTITIPPEWKVISNSDLKKIDVKIDGADCSPLCPDSFRTYLFAETKPISTYVFAFAAGEFAMFDQNISPRVMGSGNDSPNDVSAITEAQAIVPSSKIYVRQSQAEKFKMHAAEVFRLNRESVRFFENYFDYKFPFPKYDLVLIPEFPFGGMEHAGATFLRESAVIFPTEPTKNDLVSRANLIFHEAAHQWFGDLVTMQWFDDLWLKEGFATFAAYKALEKIIPEYNARKIFYERTKQAAYQTDVTAGTTPIYQEIPNLSAAKSAYGAIVYSKAPSFLRQAEFYLGEKQFQTAVRTFLKKHEFSNATWQDLVKEFESASNKNLQDWANVWVKEAGIPIIRLERIKQDATPQLKITQKSSLQNDSLWSQKVNLYQFEKNKNPAYKDSIKIEEVELARQNQQIANANADFIFPNFEDYGYGIFLLDEESRDYVLRNISAEKNDFLRTMMWGALWDSVRFYELAPEIYVDLVLNNIKRETDETTIQTLLSRVLTAMNYYIQEDARPPRKGQSRRAKIESVLLERIANAKTMGQRITFYRAFLSLASSASARKILKEILAGKSKVAVFQLRTKDKFDIVTRLLILGDRDAQILLANLEKTEKSDDARRYAYAARAGIGTAENKAKYWRDFTENKEISESWIEAAFVAFNSPLHSDLTLPYLEKALAELPELKKKRKIFFVNGWLGAFIGGQKNKQALETINKFLVDSPNLDKDLRLKVLENADNLQRAVKIRERYGKNPK